MLEIEKWMEGIWEMDYRQKGRTGQGIYKSLLWIRDIFIVAVSTLNVQYCDNKDFKCSADWEL